MLEAAGVDAPEKVHLRHAVGCDHCKGKGYKGRIGVYEILQNSRTIKQLIQNRARPSEIFDAAVNEGMRSLRHDATGESGAGPDRPEAGPRRLPLNLPRNAKSPVIAGLSFLALENQRGARRMAPSRRITSPLSMSFSMMCLASLA